MPTTLTVEQAVKKLSDGDADDTVQASLDRFLAAGKGVAVYENQDLGHRMLGHCVAFSYGTPEAQFEGPEPPERCPDGLMPHITGGINWRYTLVGVVPPIKETDDATS